MCNINLFVSKKTTLKGNEEINAIIRASAVSFAENQDGEGFYFSNNVLMKCSDGLTNLKAIIRNIQKSSVVINHARLATHGFIEDENTHPFLSTDENWVLAHNGVMTINKNTPYENDSRAFFYLLEQNGLLGVETSDDLKKVIDKTLKSISGGYSIVLHNVKTNTTYYFKSEYTTIYAFDTKRYICLTTNSKNLTNYDTEYKIEPHKLYEINKDGIFEVLCLYKERPRFDYTSYLKSPEWVNHKKGLSLWDY